MPQPFKNAVLTDSGLALLNRAQAGEVKIKFTCIVTGDGKYSEDEKSDESRQKMTELKSQKNSYPLSDISIFGEHAVKVTALITNQDPVSQAVLVNEGYYINEMGLYAKPEDDEDDENEVLYSITVTAGENGDYMPPYNGYNPAQITQDYFATVSNSKEVTINSTGAALRAEDANKLMDDVTKRKYRIGIENGLIYIQEVSD